jgi:hypothetical protein
MADAPKRIEITGGKIDAASKQPGFQPKSSYVQRLLEVTVKLAANQGTGQPIKFAGTGSDAVTLSGFRTSVRIENSGAPAGSNARVTVWGLAKGMMDQLSTLGMVFNSIQRNTVTVSAGDAENGLSPVFSGVASLAFGDYNKMPKPPFHFECQTGLIDSIVGAEASSFTGPTDVATIMAGLARQMNLGFENNGVTVQLPACYFPGTLMQQVKKCAQAAHINAERVDGDSKLAIWPIGGSRTSLQGQNIPLISKDTGMIGYPSFAPNGYMIVNSLFIPQVAFGGTIQIKSSIPQANKAWVVQKLDLALDSLVPHGEWRMTMYCYPLGFAAPVPQGATR